MIESGRAKYTYSKMHGVCCAAAHALLRVEAPLLVDEYRFARATSRTSLKPQHVERHAFRREHVFRMPCAVSRLPSTSGRMPCGSRKPSDAVADDHRDHRIAAAAAPIHGVQRREDVAPASRAACRRAAARDANTLSSTSESERC